MITAILVGFRENLRIQTVTLPILNAYTPDKSTLTPLLINGLFKK